MLRWYLAIDDNDARGVTFIFVALRFRESYIPISKPIINIDDSLIAKERSVPA
jgi:hypothetical protein